MNDLFDVIDEAHIQHTVCLIEYEYLEMLQFDIALIYQVEQPARCGYQYIYTFSERCGLRALRYATKYYCIFQSCMPAISGEALRYLYGQLAGRSEDERLDMTRSSLWCSMLLFVQYLKYRYSKSCCLACTRLCASKQVTML